MKKNFHLVETKELDENRNVLRTVTHESVILYPDEGKKLRNKKTGLIIDKFICLGGKDSPDNYEEID